MFKLVNKFLRRTGWEIRRLPPRRATSQRLSEAELAELNRILAAFAKRQPAGTDLGDVAQLRSYLSNDRVAFFHEVIKVAKEHDVSFAGCRLADVGCGTGYLLRIVERNEDPAELCGFDSFVQMNQLARMMCPSATIHDATMADLQDTFDVIFCTEVLEHLIDPAAAVRQMTNCLVTGGTLILTVPDGRNDQQDAGQRREDGSAHWGHVHFWSPESWELFLNATLDGRLQIRTSVLPSGHNFAAVSTATTPSPGAGDSILASGATGQTGS